MEMKGSCLCGQLSFEISTDNGEIYQCHCSKCRKVSGSSGNANLVVKKEEFTWSSETKTLKKYVMTENWISSFCSDCGSKAPIEDTINGLFYVPAGSLNEHKGLKVSTHVYVGSKASWDIICGDAVQIDEAI